VGSELVLIVESELLAAETKVATGVGKDPTLWFTAESCATLPSDPPSCTLASSETEWSTMKVVTE